MYVQQYTCATAGADHRRTLSDFDVSVIASPHLLPVCCTTVANCSACVRIPGVGHVATVVGCTLV